MNGRTPPASKGAGAAASEGQAGGRPGGGAASTPSDGTEIVLVALGSNLGDRAAALAHARARLAAHPYCRLEGATEPEETAPLGPAGQPPYLNQMIALTTTLSPLAMLDLLQEIESEAGRVRAERWGPRTLDCDIVRFGDRDVRHARLTVPHPEVPNRDFWRSEIDALARVGRDAAVRAHQPTTNPAPRRAS